VAGIEIRSVTDADVEGVVAVVTAAIGEEDGAEAAIVLGDPSYDVRRWTVAVDGGRVVSTVASLPAEVVVGSTELAGTAIEFVATDEGYRHQGLVRRQLDEHHWMAAQVGELIQFIVGISYFYRPLGYEYAVAMPGYHEVPQTATPPMPAGWRARPAATRDVAAIRALQRITTTPAHLQVHAPEQAWRWYLESPAYDVRVAERNGEVAAAWRVYDHEGEPIVVDLAADEAAGVAAALADTRFGETVYVLRRHGINRWLAPYGSAEPTTQAYYVRIGDPVAFLTALQPELERRLASSELAASTGEALLSLYASSIRFGYEAGSIGPFVPGPGVPAPVAAGGSGVPPDLFASLTLGPLSIGELDGRHPDFTPGEQRRLLDVLFPPLSSDVHSWVAP
jgi:predicted N-acetyltransferase YhbS